MLKWQLIREAYEAGDKTVRLICEEYEISTTTLYRQIKKQNWTARSSRSNNDLELCVNAGRVGQTPNRNVLIDRLYLAFERQMAEFEDQLSITHEDGVNEKDARTLGSLARTLEKLIELKQDSDGEMKETDEEVDVERLIEDLALRLKKCARRQKLDEVFGDLEPREFEALRHYWPIFAREDQLPPAGDWLVWLLMGGRGSGKTRAGAEWVRGMALGRSPFCHRSVGRIALVGETYSDVRDVMIEGVSGILAIHPKRERPEWKKTQRQLEWKNGAIAQAFSAEDPDALRGPQFDVAWSDEICKWRHAEATWDMLQFGLRLGERPRQVVTTTPRPVAILRRLLADDKTILSKAKTSANAVNLAPGFLEAMNKHYGGSRLGRQELDGELIEDREDALWRRDSIERMVVDKAPDLKRIVVAIDPPATSHAKSDACGIIVAGIDEHEIAYVLNDKSKHGLTPMQWAIRSVELFYRYGADLIVAEVNQGGEMVTTVIGQADQTVPVKAVRASRGKYIRAEPVAALYERGLVRHVGALGKLEDEMCDFGLNGLSSGRSPDRLDALVWALTELMLKQVKDPKIRRM